MDLSLSGKVILVTGGASGIGAAIVQSLLAEDAVPVILDRAKADGSNPARHIEVDLCDDDLVKAAVASILAEEGRIDGVVNNAGINDSVGLDASIPEFVASLEKNLVQCFSIVHHCLPHLRSSAGSILNIGSKVYSTGQGGTSGYAAAKGGLAALTREWALDLASSGIRCNAVIPAEVWTPMYEQFISSHDDPGARKSEIESRIPLGQRMTTPAEIAAMCVFLLSGRSSHTTGQIIYVDGGYTHLDRAYVGKV